MKSFKEGRQQRAASVTLENITLSKMGQETFKKVTHMWGFRRMAPHGWCNSLHEMLLSTSEPRAWRLAGVSRGRTDTRRPIGCAAGRGCPQGAAEPRGGSP